MSVVQAEGEAQGQTDTDGNIQPGCRQDWAPSTMPALRKRQGQEEHLTGLLLMMTHGYKLRFSVFLFRFDESSDFISMYTERCRK